MTHTVNGQAFPQGSDEQKGAAGCATATHSPLSEAQMYANLVDAVKMLEKMIEHTHYNCTQEEAELIWRLRFVTRIEP